jgi:hypothetical protein
MYRVSTLSADQSIEIRLSQDIYQILVQQGFEVLVSGSQRHTFDCLNVSTVLRLCHCQSVIIDQENKILIVLLQPQELKVLDPASMILLTSRIQIQ